jgi:hypothetical protein
LGIEDRGVRIEKPDGQGVDLINPQFLRRAVRADRPFMPFQAIPRIRRYFLTLVREYLLRTFLQGETLLPHTFFFGFLLCRSDCHAAGKIWRVCPESISAFLDNYQELFHYCFPFNPACFNTLLSVPGGISRPAIPEMVTNPDLMGCVNWR